MRILQANSTSRKIFVEFLFTTPKLYVQNQKAALMAKMKSPEMNLPGFVFLPSEGNSLNTEGSVSVEYTVLRGIGLI